MSDSSDDEKPQNVYVPFGQREEWKDVTPVPQDDGPNPVCRIAYDDQFTDTMNYFRAIVRSDERSPRALAITGDAIRLNTGNYTAWYYRRLVLDSLKSDLPKELEFITSIGIKNPKNYQIWYHRRAIVEKLGDYSRERQYTEEHIQQDSKNYHAWAHRQWVVETNGWWDTELEYIDKLLQYDVRNNSAWNQRYFAITRNKTRQVDQNLATQETDYAISYAKKAPNNQSPWLYIKGLNNQDVGKLKEICEHFHQNYPTSPHAAGMLAELHQKEGNKTRSDELYNLLANNLDSIHKKYWIYKMQQE
ncbi:hypothetical protein PROFUN_07323 [Planoprotostelium fungivorum]|uniref:Protein farnesyltransferase/geranylgeranyltransferase type-1 subunit alpha n=1 Tax=Planoprotostelium fungivorum TaxID=1890364 RepID=A0A2P6NM44_9EUKA|nr:hypothetical protein PROFUN_07323 [Planoprotostelium fungivorum]